MNIATVLNVTKNIGTKAAAGIATAVRSDAVKKLSLSAAVGAVGVLGQKGCEKMISGAEKMQKKAETKKVERHLKKREDNIKSWADMSCEDLI